MAFLTLAQASIIVDAALAEGRGRHFAPLAVAVLDAGGHLVAFKREDGAGFARFDIAYGKAWGALGMGLQATSASNPHGSAARRSRLRKKPTRSMGGVSAAHSAGCGSVTRVIGRRATPAAVVVLVSCRPIRSRSSEKS